MSGRIYRSRWTPVAFLAVGLFALAIVNARADDPPRWSSDAAHTEINFSVTHFFTPVTGRFEDYEITLDYDAENPEKSSLEALIAVASINTGNAQRTTTCELPTGSRPTSIRT